MAGDWIKWTKGLHRKPEILGIAELLNVSPLHAAGLCMALWEWLDDNITEAQIDELGNAFVTLGPLQHRFIDRLLGIDGFADALATVGWLELRPDAIVFPNFTRHNSSTGKMRAVTAVRVTRYRSKKVSPEHDTCNAASVTSVTPQALHERYQRREEKRREDLEPPACAGGFSESDTLSKTTTQQEGDDLPLLGEAASAKATKARRKRKELPVLVFPCVGKLKTWALTKDQVAAWQRLYPTLNVLAECRKAYAWIDATPTRKKTARGMKTFLVRWLNKATNEKRTPMKGSHDDPTRVRTPGRYEYDPIAMRMVCVDETVSPADNGTPIPDTDADSSSSTEDSHASTSDAD